MSRPLRLEFAGALYHITSRGNRREAIYETDVDRVVFLSILDDVCGRFNWNCHVYCLMTNHYHLLIETPEGNLSQGMRQLNGVYTQRFNRNHSRVGHVFQGRYKAILVDKNSYLLELARYIVLNPVRARMVALAKDWPWSSYLATVGEKPSPECLSVDWLLAAFGKRKSTAIKAYKRFVEEGVGCASPWRDLKNQLYLGDDVFVEEMQALLEKDKDLSEVPKTQRRLVAKPLAEYDRRSNCRNDAIVKAYESGGYSMSEMGNYFGLHYSVFCGIISRAKSKT